MESEEVLWWLRGEVKHPPSLKPHKPSKFNELVISFFNTLDFLLLQKDIHELCTSLSTKDYLTATFMWSSIVNKQLRDSKLWSQQCKDLITKFEEQNSYTTMMCTNKDIPMAVTQEVPEDIRSL